MKKILQNNENIENKENIKTKENIENIENIKNIKNKDFYDYKTNKNFKDFKENFNPFEELKKLFEFINSQPETTSIKNIKIYLNQICGKIEFLEEFVNKTSDSLNFRQTLQDLSDQNTTLSKSLQKIEKEIKAKNEGLTLLQEKIQFLEFSLIEKETEMQELTKVNTQLKEAVSSMQLLEYKSNSRKIIELESELEEKSYEIIVLHTENKRLGQNFEQSESANKVHLNIIEDLKEKLKALRIENYEKFEKNICQNPPKSSESKDSSNSTETLPKEKASVYTQTLTFSKHKKRQSSDTSKPTTIQDLLSYSSCMASALEAFLTSSTN